VKLKRIGVVAAVVLVAGALAMAFWRLGNSAKESSYAAVPAQKGDITQVVSATGTLQAVVTVQVGSQVSGTIARLNADFNSKVKQGQVVAELLFGEIKDLAPTQVPRKGDIANLAAVVIHVIRRVRMCALVAGHAVVFHV